MTKKCSKCENKSITNRPYLRQLCESCFLKAIEKKIRKYIRIKKKINKNDRLLVKDKLSLYFVKRIISMPIKIVKIKPDKTVNLYTLDDKVSDFLAGFMLKEKIRIKKNEISLFETITDEELRIFSKIKKLDFKPNKKNKSIHNFLDKLYKRYPEARFSIVKSCDEIKRYGK
jgi:hypothetical protein